MLVRCRPLRGWTRALGCGAMAGSSGGGVYTRVCARMCTTCV